jgi:hypothetical protein
MTRFRAAYWLIGALFVVSAAGFYYIIRTPPDDCVPPDVPNQLSEQTMQYLNGVIEFDMTLGTGLIGLGAALLIGLQGNVQITFWRITWIFLAMISLAQSLVYAILWKLAVANLVYNDCWGNISSALVQSRFSGHLYFLLAGVGFMAAMVLLLAYGRLTEQSKAGGE